MFSIGIVPLLFLALLRLRRGVTASASTASRLVAVYLLLPRWRYCWWS